MAFFAARCDQLVLLAVNKGVDALGVQIECLRLVGKLVNVVNVDKTV